MSTCTNSFSFVAGNCPRCGESLSSHPKRPTRKTRGSTHSAIKSAVGATPRRATSHDMQGTVHTPKEFVPLLRPDGPYYGSGT